MSLTDFKNNFNGGTRANRFYIEGSFPGGSFNKFHVTSTSIPALGTDAFEYNHFGRAWKFPGEKTYTNTWSFTVLDDYQEGDNSINLWRQFHSWQNLINDHDTNISKKITSATTYKADNIKIYHLGINGEQSSGATTNSAPLKKFILNGCFPQVIKGISFNMSGASNNFNSFTVTMSWDSIEIGGITRSSENDDGPPLAF